jgi:PilX N-terminal
MRAQSERGVALILALFLMTALSVLAASLMFLSQTETYASMNYRMMSQARYAAEAGVQKAADHLLTTYQATMPVSTELLSEGGAVYNNNVSPVLNMANNQPIVLSAKDGTCTGSNYPVTAVQTAFCNAAKGSLAAGTATITYNATATLLAMQSFTSYGGGKVVVQTWQIVGDGGLTGARNATVEVMATVEQPRFSVAYSAFATDTGCAALTIGGNPATDSYNSGGMTGTTAPTLAGEGGDVGTNGNIDVTGTKVTVKGHLYTPRTGVGACVDGTNVTALTQSGKADVSGSLVQLPKSIVLPTPTIPSPSPIGTVTNPSCADLGLTAGVSAADVTTGPATAQCFSSTSGGVTTMTINGHGSTLSLPNISLSGQFDLVLVASSTTATYDLNGFSESGQATIGVKPTASTNSVVVNIVGKNPDSSEIATPLDLTGGSYAAPDISSCAACSSYDASKMQFVYGGTAQIKMTGNSSSAATFYAPNADITVAGNTDIYGAIIGKTIDFQGNSNIYYDSNLESKFLVPGSPVIGTFTWKRF